MTRQSPTTRTSQTATRSAFTLTEMLVVVAIMGIMLGLVIPGVSGLWAQRNESASENMLQGLLASARTRAIRTGGHGLFFYVDADGAQRVVFIEAEPPGPPIEGYGDADDCDAASLPLDCVDQVDAVDRFRVVEGDIYTIPKPYRVAPMWALDADWSVNPPNALWDVQLTIDSWGAARGADTPRYHRNYFVVMFNGNGELVVNRRVLIHDRDGQASGNPGYGYGDLTQMPVAAEISMTYEPGNATAVQINSSSTGKNPDLFDIIYLPREGAANNAKAARFMSVDGLVVYDESDMEGFDGEGRWRILTERGRPYFIGRYTGDVILGPRTAGL